MPCLLAVLPLLLLSGPPSGPARPRPGPVLETVAYRSGREVVRGVLCHPAGTGRAPAVVLVHGDQGLTAWVKEQAKRLAAAGYVGLAVDLYRGEVGTDVLDAHILARGLPEDRVQADLKGAVDYLAGRPDVHPGSLGILGWDIGGGYALDAALHDPRLRAVVVCYGRLTTDPASLAPLRAPVLGIFAGKDEGIPPETQVRFRAAMRKAGKRLAGLYTYPACGHGFMDPSSQDAAGPPQAEAIHDAWKKIETFLAAELKPARPRP